MKVFWDSFLCGLASALGVAMGLAVLLPFLALALWFLGVLR